MILEPCKGVHCVDLGESFQTHIYLQNLASIQPRTSPLSIYLSRIGRGAATADGVEPERGVIWAEVEICGGTDSFVVAWNCICKM